MRSEKGNVEALYEIVYYCGSLKSAVEYFGADYEKFVDKKKFLACDACVFYVLRIGEYAKKLTDAFRAEHSEIVWHEIIGLRNKIFHDYRIVIKDVLWKIMLNDVPKLREYCRRILFELEPRAEDSLRAELSELGIE